MTLPALSLPHRLLERSTLAVAAALLLAACGGSELTDSATNTPDGIEIVAGPEADEATPAAESGTDTASATGAADSPPPSENPTLDDGDRPSSDDGTTSDGPPSDGEGAADGTAPSEEVPAATVRPPDAPTAAPGDEPDTTVLVGPLPVPAVELALLGRFGSPVEVTSRPGDTRTLIVEQAGRVLAVDDLAEDVLADISDLVRAGGEQGLLGLAYHPSDPLAYVYYTDASGDSVVAEYGVDPRTGEFDTASAREVLRVGQPFSNHNGGELAFGPDGMLYIGLGDGGSANDPERASLDLTSLLGKILRIDPRATADAPYSIPDDNPYVGAEAARPEVWASGLRNPWRFSFDPATGDLWIADVGQQEFEEISVARAADGGGRGLSFGWSAFEGFEPFNADQQAVADAERPNGLVGQTPPVFVYNHSDGNCSVSGGAVARDNTIPELRGWYVFGDYCSGRIWGYDTTSAIDQPRVVELGQFDALAAIAAGPDGTLYAVSNSGPIAAIVPA